MDSVYQNVHNSISTSQAIVLSVILIVLIVLRLQLTVLHAQCLKFFKTLK
jgi:hypothetical protein